MKPLVHFVLFALIAVFIGSTSIPAEASNTDADSEIRAVLQAQQDAWNRGDIDAFMNGYWRSEETVFVSGDDVARGWQKVLDRYKKKYSDRAKMGTLAFSNLEITSLSSDSAVVLGSWQLKREQEPPSQSATPARSSGVPGQPHGRFTLILRHFPEGWRIIHDHTSAAEK